MTKEAVTIKVPSEDPKKKKSDEPIKAPQKEPSDEIAGPGELSDEDKKLKEDLELSVTRICDPKEQPGVKKLALETLRELIRTATASMTSVPKPLKFLRPHYDSLKTAYDSMGALQKALADILSVLAMTMAPEGSRESLSYKLKGNSTELGVWGHEFVRSLAGEVGEVSNRIECDNLMLRDRNTRHVSQAPPV
jgi:26S proteasome regulatory subunit N1